MYVTIPEKGASIWHIVIPIPFFLLRKGFARFEFCMTGVRVRGSWSAAEVEWDNRSRLGIRWNGDDVSKVGSPQSRGNPTWFIVPDEIAVDVLKLVDTLKQRDTDELDAGYLAMANDTEREAEAMEWVEGLISDSA